jgi:hypothetical protein
MPKVSVKFCLWTDRQYLICTTFHPVALSLYGSRPSVVEVSKPSLRIFGTAIWRGQWSSARLLPTHNMYTTEIQIWLHIPSGVRVHTPVYELQTTVDTPERAVTAVCMQYRRKLFIFPSRRRMMDRNDTLSHPVLTALLGGGNPSASRPGLFTPRKAAQAPTKQVAVCAGQQGSILWR